MTHTPRRTTPRRPAPDDVATASAAEERSPRRLDPRAAALLAAGAAPAAGGAAVGVVAAMVWIVGAIATHGLVAYVAMQVSEGRSDAHQGAQRDEQPRVEWVEVELPVPEPEPTPEPEPEPVPEPEPTPEPELALPEELPPPVEPELPPEPAPEPEPPPQKPEPKKRSEPAARSRIEAPPKEAKIVDDPLAKFDDFGALEASTSDQGTIAITTGSSAEGPIRPTSKGSREAAAPREGRGTAAEGTKDGAPEGSGKSDAPVSRAQLDRKAEPNEAYNRKIKAAYPPELKLAGVEADVIAILTVSSDGTVTQVKVVNASKVDAAFVRAAEEAFKKFRFSAAVKDGKPVTSEVRLVYRFRLDDL